MSNSKACASAFVFLISVIVPICYGVLDPKLSGRIMPTVFTPYNQYGKPNLELVRKLAEFFAERHIKNIQILGFYGEGPSLDVESRKALISAWVKETDRLGLNFVVEIAGGLPYYQQLELARYCSQINVSAISAFPILVYEAENYEEIIEDYQGISDAAPNLPLLYRDLSETGPKITPAQAVAALIGKVKTCVGGVISMDAALDVKTALPSVDGYQLWIFGTKSIAPSLINNMNVSVTNFVNLCPKLALAIEAAVDAGRYDEALEMQQQANRMLQAITSNNRKVIDYNSRDFFKYLRAAFLILHKMDLGARLPFEKANDIELERIRCNLVEFKDFIECYCS